MYVPPLPVTPLDTSSPLQLPVYRLIVQPIRSGSPPFCTTLPFRSLNLWALIDAGRQLPKRTVWVCPALTVTFWHSGVVFFQPLASVSCTE